MKDFVVVITGAAGGIGSALVRRFLDAGQSVVAVDFSDEGLGRLAETSGKPANLTCLRCDITQEDEVQALAARVEQMHGGITALVNCAGLFPPCAFEAMSFSEWRRIMAVNLDGVFLMTHAFLPLMKQRNFGRIVNIGSSSFFQGTALYTHYVAAKAGVMGFTRSLAREVAQYGITANVVAPGLTSTEIVLRSAPGTILEDRKSQRAIQRHQQADDLVGTVAFLCSRDADFITGQTINVDGGAVMH
jgi:NAD(P)-dependent dehydrogenase (short-subunit alcohol dehydrogenase family)